MSQQENTPTEKRNASKGLPIELKILLTLIVVGILALGLKAAGII